MLVKAEKPNGLPQAELKTEAGRTRFQRLGYDVFANLTCDTLLFDQLKSFDEVTPIAQAVVMRVNGIARLLEPDYWPVSLYTISYSAPGGSGAANPGKTTPNKQYTGLGRHPNQLPFADEVFNFGSRDDTISFVLEAITLPTSWTSLYLVYEAIAKYVGGQHELEKQGWVTKDELSKFRLAANKTRIISEGARHADLDADPTSFIRLVEAHGIINRLAVRWLDAIRNFVRQDAKQSHD